MLGLTEYLDRLPKALSGGQRQRVAMGRAIVRSPQVFLMDEPLSNLDAKLRVQMRSEIIQIQKRLDTTMVYVTHDQIEAMTMGHRVAVMRLGVLQQVAHPQELYQRPANLFVAAFIGSPAMNLINVTLGGTAERPTASFAGHTLAIDEGAIERYPQIVDRIGSSVVLGLRPEHFSMEGDFDLPDDQIVEFKIELAEAMGAEAHLHITLDVPVVELDGQPVSAEDGDETPLSTTKIIARIDGIHFVTSGENLRLGVKTHLAHFFDPDTGLPLS
jgi:multiple sugar transport system ATP-binding protein